MANIAGNNGNQGGAAGNGNDGDDDYKYVLNAVRHLSLANMQRELEQLPIEIARENARLERVALMEEHAVEFSTWLRRREARREQFARLRNRRWPRRNSQTDSESEEEENNMESEEEDEEDEMSDGEREEKQRNAQREREDAFDTFWQKKQHNPRLFARHMGRHYEEPNSGTDESEDHLGNTDYASVSTSTTATLELDPAEDSENDSIGGGGGYGSGGYGGYGSDD